MFGRRRLAAAQQDLEIKRGRQKVASENYIAALENSVEKNEAALRSSEQVIEQQQRVIEALRTKVTALENLVEVQKSMPQGTQEDSPTD